MPNHVVKQGEYLALIAEKAGFRDALTVWNAPENAELRKRRQNPNVLYPGDVIFVPEKQQKTLSRSTDQHHVFVAKIDRLKLRVVLLDFDHRPLAGVPAILEVDGNKFELVSDSAGAYEQAVPRSAQHGRFRVEEFGIDFPLHIGELDPVENDSGWRARLINLGYYRGLLTDSGSVAEKFFGWALEEFQCDSDLKVTGIPDATTLARLKKLHGS
jgi:hypothetical protein